MITKISKYLAAVGAALTLVLASGYLPSASAQSPGALTRDAVLRDPDIPVLGNPNGDITIVEYLDYQCSYCKKVHPDLLKVVKEDGKIRLVFKDWPIFGATSEAAAKLVLATKYQNKFAEAHAALMNHKGKLREEDLPGILTTAGVDAQKAAEDLKANEKHIADILARNSAQAEALGFNGTPSFIVGTFRIPGVLEPEVFKQAIKDARAMQAKENKEKQDSKKNGKK